jgi:hypothetical protein
MRHNQEFKMMKIAHLLFSRGRLMVLATLLLGSLPTYAATYIFPGNLPAGCSQSNATTFACGIVNLATGDNITVASDDPITVNFSGALTVGDGSLINFSDGTTNEKLNFNFNGVFTVGTNSKVRAIVYGTAAVTIGASSEIGPITTTAGVVAIGIGSTVHGSIATQAGAVTLGANSKVEGRIVTAAGVVTVGNNSKVTEGITTTAGAITLGDSVIVNGNLETPTGVITLGANTKVSGSIKTFTATQGAGAVNVGDHSSIGGNIETDAGVVTLTTYVAVGGSVMTVAGAITVGDHSEICGNATTTGAGVITMTTNVHVGGDVSTVAGAVTIGNGSAAGGSVKSTGAGVVTMTGVKVGGDVSTVVGGITLTNSNIRGTVKIYGAGVMTITGGTTQDSTVFVPAGGCVTATSVHHYELSVPSSSIACVETPIGVKACADAACSSTVDVNSSINLDSTPSSIITPATLMAGVGTASLRYPNAADGTSVMVSLNSANPTASNATTCEGGSCATVFNRAGFIFSKMANGSAVTTFPIQVAGKSSGTYFLRAVKSNTATQACEVALTGTQSINLAYQCNNPGTCYAENMMSVNGGRATTIARNAGNSGVASYTSVDLTFDAKGNAPVTFVYSDVGQVKLWASKAASGLLLTPLTGSSNAFVIKPGGFVLSVIKQTVAPQLANPAAVDAAGLKFIKAGEAFSVTVTATTTPVSGARTTPSYGRETIAEGVKLVSTLVAPTAGLPGTLRGSFSPFINGVATGTGFAWSEVGIMKLTPSIASGDYLGVAGDVTGTVSGNVGRFIPDHFITAVTQACLAGAFTYSGQPFTVVVTAMSGDTPPVVTQNYDGTSTNVLSYAKSMTLSDASTTSVGALAPTTFLASKFTQGIAALTTPSYIFTTAETEPTTIKLRALDTDSVTSAANAEGLVPVRSGRIKFPNRYGSQSRNLDIFLVLQYWDNGWKKNGADTCTLLMAKNFGFDFPVAPKNNLKACDTALILSHSSSDYSLSLSQPVGQSSGWVDITLNLGASVLQQPTATQCLGSGGPGVAEVPANLPWLQYNWTGTTGNPKARVKFGDYRSSSIYRQENH